MKFLRLCLLAVAFLAFPLALITFADITVVEKELPDLLGETAREAAASPETQAEFAQDLGNLWIEENPEIASQLTDAGLDPVNVMIEAFNELSKTDAFANELDRAATEYGISLVDGTSPQISLDFTEAIGESGIDFDPAVLDSLGALATVDATPLENQDVSKFSRWAERAKQMSGFIALGAFILMLGLARSARPPLASLFFVGMPALLLQRFVLQEITNDPDPVDALIGQTISATWLPWTHLMMAVSAGALFVLLVSYKLFPETDFNTIPYAKNSNFVPERPISTPNPDRAIYQTGGAADSYDWGVDDDHSGLRELSIIED